MQTFLNISNLLGNRRVEFVQLASQFAHFWIARPKLRLELSRLRFEVRFLSTKDFKRSARYHRRHQLGVAGTGKAVTGFLQNAVGLRLSELLVPLPQAID